MSRFYDKEELPDGGKSTFRFALMLCNIHMYLCIRYYSAARSSRVVHMRACAKVLRDVFFASHAGRRRERSSGVLAQESCK